MFARPGPCRAAGAEGCFAASQCRRLTPSLGDVLPLGLSALVRTGWVNSRPTTGHTLTHSHHHPLQNPRVSCASIIHADYQKAKHCSSPASLHRKCAVQMKDITPPPPLPLSANSLKCFHLRCKYVETAGCKHGWNEIYSTGLCLSKASVYPSSSFLLWNNNNLIIILERRNKKNKRPSLGGDVSAILRSIRFYGVTICPGVAGTRRAGQRILAAFYW